MIRKILKEKINSALKKAGEEKNIKFIEEIPVELSCPREEKFGDYSTNIAMNLAKNFKLPPDEVADLIVKFMTKEEILLDIKIAGSGFINFYLKKEVFHLILKKILEEKDSFGRPATAPKDKICLEFVSVNPTGPMHIAHGRWAAVGDTLANILEFSRFNISREYYVNDYGTQLELLGESLNARYLEILGKDAPFPEDGYKGQYLKEFAEEIVKKDKDKYLELSYEDRSSFFKDLAGKVMLNDIKKVMKKACVKFDTYFSERSLHENGLVEETFQRLISNNLAYEKDGAWWFKSLQFGDEKDRVIKKESGQPTYFLSDIAYHINKINRGFNRLINIWGADHHAHVKKMQDSLASLGYPEKVLTVLVGQMVTLIRQDKAVRMSKRKGEIVTFEELLDEVGKDAVRFFFLTRSINSHLDFDVDLAKKSSHENPVYYIQYAYARICNILKEAEKENINYKEIKLNYIEYLKEAPEINLIKKMEKFPYIIKECSERLEPHHLPHYLHELSSLFHSFYNTSRVLKQEKEITSARLLLLAGCRLVLYTGLNLLGVNAPERM